MAFTLPPLPYAFDALEPYIDKQTMEIHHDKHHAAYVTNLNKALEQAPALQDKPIEALLADNCSILRKQIQTAVRNNGGGHVNHSMFWTILAPNAGGNPTGNVAQAINSTFGSFDQFKEKFNAAATTPIRFRLGVAREEQQGHPDYLQRQSGFADYGRQLPGDGPGCLGARVLSEVSEPPARVHCGVVELGELGGDREKI